jgi:hypothetical protein
MSDKEHLDKEELLSGYIDGQLTPRQLTEFKRLLAHDPNLHKELESLEQQRQLLQSLPVETAPVLMAEEIRSVLERRFILADSSHSINRSDVWGLRLRKIAAVAAMVLLPLVILATVVITILQPEKTVPGVAAEIMAVNPAPAAEPLFSAVLQFQTRQPIAANDYIEKKIHTLGLMNFTTPGRQSDRTSYKIICSRKYIESLVGELGELWPRCEKASYAILDTSTNQPVRVEAIDPQQTLTMIQLTDTSNARKLAQDITEQNAQKAIAKTNPTDTAPQPLAPKVSKPILAWDEGKQQVLADEPDTICLVIEVLGQ